MRIVCIADTHNKHDRLLVPEGDVLIHAGDITEGGTRRELISFMKWFEKQPHEHKVFIGGNHDYYLEKVDIEDLNNNLSSNVHYLHNSSVEINGLKFWGTPQSPSMSNWAFGDSFFWKDIPLDTDVLISHIPPFDILDLHDRNHNLGDTMLRKRIEELNLKLHVFGHVHDSYGLTRLRDTIFINASSQSEIGHYLNPPIIFDTRSFPNQS